jgi:CRP-like cAMP-binding protein
MTGLGPGDFFGEMTVIEMQNRSATVVVESPTVLYELTARNLYTYYKADIHAYVIVMQNINRELRRRLRRADNRIAELADASGESTTQTSVRHGVEKKQRPATMGDNGLALRQARVANVQAGPGRAVPVS